MESAVLDAVEGADALIMAAAVADYRPAVAADQKMKKSGSPLELRLIPTRDILASVTERYGDRLVKVGFAAESRDLLSEASRKLAAKGLHLICANDVTEAGSGFGADTNRVTIIGRDGFRLDLPLLPKSAVAERILDQVQALFEQRAATSLRAPGVG
jgi:phosphopantothenoylcysteine decarboxylase/phosphopantothenate--cysteine ligase